MSSFRYSHEEKIRHLLNWALGWSGGTRGESAWSYSLKLGGSHALLNGWMKNLKITSSLTQEERDMVNEARIKSNLARRWPNCAGKRLRSQEVMGDRMTVASGSPERHAALRCHGFGARNPDGSRVLRNGDVKAWNAT